MSFNKIYFLILIVLLLSFSSKTFSQNEVFVDGEELYYEVYYSFINIGWIKFYTQRVPGKIDTYQCYATMKSNDALPFVTVNYEFYSEIAIRNNTVEPLKFISKEFKEGKQSEIVYIFDYTNKTVELKKTGFKGEKEFEKKINLSCNYQDGLSIFYYARFHSFKKESVNVPVLMNQDSISITLNFNTANEEINIDEIDYDISSVYIDGFTDYELVFGLTGEFSGWFSRDAARIPLYSNLEVKIGKVKVELKSWKRKNWKAPKYNL